MRLGVYCVSQTLNGAGQAFGPWIQGPLGEGGVGGSDLSQPRAECSRVGGGSWGVVTRRPPFHLRAPFTANSGPSARTWRHHHLSQIPLHTHSVLLTQPGLDVDIGDH